MIQNVINTYNRFADTPAFQRKVEMHDYFFQMPYTALQRFIQAMNDLKNMNMQSLKKEERNGYLPWIYTPISAPDTVSLQMYEIANAEMGYKKEIWG